MLQALLVHVHSIDLISDDLEEKALLLMLRVPVLALDEV